jgi:hypothetical protein
MPAHAQRQDHDGRPRTTSAPLGAEHCVAGIDRPLEQHCGPEAYCTQAIEANAGCVLAPSRTPLPPWPALAMRSPLRHMIDWRQGVAAQGEALGGEVTLP